MAVRPSLCLSHVPRSHPRTSTRLYSTANVAGWVTWPGPKSVSPKADYAQFTISTLRREALTKADFIHFPTEQEYAQIWDARAVPVTAVSPDNRRSYARFRPGGRGSVFPAGLQGYLYYYVPPGPAPSTAGEIRFREMHSPSPLSFNNGTDLTAAHRLPWRIQLPSVASNDAYQVFRTILLVIAFTTLRDLSPSAYQTVKWTTFWPHIG